MKLFVVIVEKPNGSVFTAGVFDEYQPAWDCMLEYSGKYGQLHTWINTHKLNVKKEA